MNKLLRPTRWSLSVHNNLFKEAWRNMSESVSDEVFYKVEMELDSNAYQGFTDDIYLAISPRNK